MHRVLIGFLGFCCIAIGFYSCEQDYVPKPRAYYRINFPEKEYEQWQSDCPYDFEIPNYASIAPDMAGDEKYCWMNVEFQTLRASLHLSYKPIIEDGDLQRLINDSYTFVEKHNEMAEQISEKRIRNSANSAAGLIFKIGGNTASNLQFFLTDSTDHFVRASLYFNCEPNKDSLAPVVDFIAQDIDKIIESFNWTDKTIEVYR